MACSRSGVRVSLAPPLFMITVQYELDSTEVLRLIRKYVEKRYDLAGNTHIKVSPIMTESFSYGERVQAFSGVVVSCENPVSKGQEDETIKLMVTEDRRLDVGQI
jgi:hypothetical protein